jgi:hypothetical protein
MMMLRATHMYLNASTAGLSTSSREYFECTYWSLATSRTLDMADKWRIMRAVFGTRNISNRQSSF